MLQLIVRTESLRGRAVNFVLSNEDYLSWLILKCNMIKSLLMLSRLLIPTLLYGQDFEVIYTKRSFKENGDKIRKGDQLTEEDVVLVKENGLLTLDISYPRKLTMEEGRHHLGSLIEDLKSQYARHKKLSAYLSKRGLLDCKFAYKAFIVPGSNRHYEADRITISKASFDKPRQLNIEWENPDKQYGGNHYVIIQQGYGQELLIDVIESEDSSQSVNLDDYKEHFLQYSVVAEDCRASLKRKIKRDL